MLHANKNQNCKHMATTASISRLVVQYRRCEGLSALLQYATTSSRSSWIWLKTLPSPKLLASVSRTYCPVSVGKAKIGASISEARKARKAAEQLVSHTNGTSFPVKCTNGVATSRKLRDKTPVVSHKSQKLSHTLQTSSIFFGSHSRPRRPTIWPRKGTDSRNKWHLLDFSCKPYERNLSNINVKLDSPAPNVPPKEMISSR